MNTGDLSWIKLDIRIFDDNKIKVIEALPDGHAIILCWLKLICMAGQQNEGGYVYLNRDIPYTSETLAALWREKRTVVELAVDTFKKLGMIEVETDGKIFIINYLKYNGEAQSLENIRERSRIRSREYRLRLKESIKENPKEENTLKEKKGVTENHVTVTLPSRDAVSSELPASLQTPNRKPISPLPFRFMNILMEEGFEKKTIEFLGENFDKITKLTRAKRFSTGKAMMAVLRSIGSIYEEFGYSFEFGVDGLISAADKWRPDTETLAKVGLAGWIDGKTWLNIDSKCYRQETELERQKRLNEEWAKKEREESK